MIEIKQRRRQLQKMIEIYDLIGWMRKNNRAARPARTLVEFFDIVCQTTNLQIYGFKDDVNNQQQMFHSLYFKSPTSPCTCSINLNNIECEQKAIIAK